MSGKKMIGWCAKCRDRREITDGKVVTMKNKRKAYRGPCVKCGTTVNRILSEADAKELKA